MKKLIFIRHGATAGNLEKRYIGRTDEPLCDLGISQIQKLKELDFQIDQLYVSPMLRTKQTAEILFPQIPQIEVPDFRETDFGIFEGKTYAELSDCPEYQAWLDSNCLGPIPGGESVSDFKNRCCEAFREVMAAIPENTTTAFVVHGGTIMAILEAYAHPKRDFYQYSLKNGEWCTCLCYRKSLQIIEKWSAE